MDVIFDWDAVSGVDGYNIYLNKDSGGYVKDNTSLITDLEYYIESIATGSYAAYVTSVVDGLESDPSNIESFVIS